MNRILRGFGVAAAVVALAATATFAGGKTTFTGLGTPGTEIWGANDDCSKAVGLSDTGEYFYWTKAEGVVNIGGGGQAGRVVVSGDGNVIAGSIFDENGIGVAAKWLGGTDWQVLEPLPGSVPCGNDLNSAWGIDQFGLTLVGLTWLPQECRAIGARWDLVNGGPAQSLGTLVPNRPTRGNDISGDGRIVVGWQDLEAGERAAARWVDGVEELVLTPTGEYNGEIGTVNFDGTAMTGTGYKYAGNQVAWVWTAKRGFTPIDSGTIWNYNVPTAQSGDGSLVVGIARNQNGIPRAWFFQITGSKFTWMDEYLSKKGLAPGWKVLALNAVSVDGHTLMGYGRNPDGRIEGFIIENF